MCYLETITNVRDLEKSLELIALDLDNMSIKRIENYYNYLINLDTIQT